MHKTALAVVVTFVAAFSGCVDEGKNDLRDLADVFGAANVVSVPNVSDLQFILIPALEGRYVTDGDANATWAMNASAVADVDPLVLPETDPGRQGGGRNEVDLMFPNATLEIRFAKASELKGYNARYALVSEEMISGEDNSTPLWSDPTAVEDTYSVPAQLGSSLYAAELLVNNETRAVILIPFMANLTVHWNVKGSIFPLRPDDPSGSAPVSPPPPENYDEMGDEFTVDLGAESNVFVSTVYDGSYQPGTGNDLGIQILDEDRAPVPDACADSASPAGPAGTPDLSPTNTTPAGEKLIFVLQSGTWILRVGACYGSNFYNNIGPIPYVAEIYLGPGAPRE